MTERDRYHHGDLRGALVDAALELLEAEGSEAVTLRAVARAVGVSHAAPYHHFEDKASLEVAMTKQIRLDLAQTLSTVATASGGDSPDLAVAYVVWAIEHPQRFRMLKRAHSFVDNVTTTPPQPARGFAFDLLMDSMRVGQESGYFADNDPQDLALAAWAAVHGLATLLLDGRLTDGPPTVSEARRLAFSVTRVLGYGLLRR